MKRMQLRVLLLLLKRICRLIKTVIFKFESTEQSVLFFCFIKFLWEGGLNCDRKGTYVKSYGFAAAAQCVYNEK